VYWKRRFIFRILSIFSTDYKFQYFLYYYLLAEACPASIEASKAPKIAKRMVNLMVFFFESNNSKDSENS
jgi:hypothetical protein